MVGEGVFGLIVDHEKCTVGGVHKFIVASIETHVPDVTPHVNQGGSFWHQWMQGIAIRQEIFIVCFCF